MNFNATLFREVAKAMKDNGLQVSERVSSALPQLQQPQPQRVLHQQQLHHIPLQTCSLILFHVEQFNFFFFFVPHQ